jgi:glyoxalase family protein
VKLEGIHHVTAVTADAQRNVDFYVGVLGLRLVKKSVNQDNTSVYHLFYADETGDPGSDITFFEYPRLPIGRAGAGMVHRIVWRVQDNDAIGFWHDRLSKAGHDPATTDDALVFHDPEGLEHELAIVATSDEPLIAHHPEIPSDRALQGFHAVRAYSDDPPSSRDLLERTLGFAPATANPTPAGPAPTPPANPAPASLGAPAGAAWEVRGDHRSGYYVYDPPPPERPRKGAGTVHHVAWATHPGDIDAWHVALAGANAHPTPVIDRHYFRSVYFREPSGVLFEIATIGPGFTADEPFETLGESLSLPPNYEQYRSQVEQILMPLPNPRLTRSGG